MHLDVFHLLRNLTIHCQAMSKALGVNWNLQMWNNEAFANWMQCTWLYSWMKTSLCMGLPMKICTHEGVQPFQYTILEGLKHNFSASYIAIHALVHWQLICHFLLYHISIVINIFWQLLENVYKDISLCYDYNIY